MRLKSFTARTLPEAMRRVREALGPDAVMLSNQPSEDGKGVRVTAAVEDGPLDDFGFDPAVGGISPIDGISEALTYHRIPPALFDRLIGAAAILSAQDPALVLAAALDNEFTFLPLTDTAAQCPIMLVGPPGAGKTATTAKLCARARMAGGEVSLITMDTVKSGGMAQISAFAEALKARLQPAADIDALAAAVKETTADQLVIIDTVGANPFNDDDMDHIFLAAKAAGATPILVLPAGGDAADAAEAALAFARAGAKRLIATRLDTARRLGGLLSAAQAGELALVGASASPNIADGLTVLNPVSLARLLLPAPAADERFVLTRETG